MATSYLTHSFKSLIESQSKISPRLMKDLGQVNVVLAGYARSRGLTGDKKSLAGKLSVLDICINSENLHPDLIVYIEALHDREKYKGQHLSRIKKLVRSLPWESPDKSTAEEPPPFRAHPS